ncbi:MAG TPA: protoporphyrinogen oxidase [Ktedonobacterales bacterium]|nr:protoporphyrinogen oxidase [Ktedonobacterales bacterium]
MSDRISERSQPPSLSGGREGGLCGGTPLGAALAASAHVVILGGGITGLSAAWHLQQAAARDGLSITYTLIEQSSHWGGKVRSEVIERDGAPAWVLEAGPDGLLTRKPWALSLARDLRLDEHFLFVNRANSRTFVLRRGRPEPLPAGLQLLAPTQWRPFLRSPLFSPWGKARIALDMLVPPRRATDDESLASFVRRRFGDEALRRLAEPMLAGVYNAEPERQSILATFPQFPTLERAHGSVIRGLRAASRQPPAETPAFLSFDIGNQALVDALVAQLTGALRLNTTVCGIAQADGGGYELRLDDGASLAADAVILATPANVAATLTRATAPEAATLLTGIRYAGIGAIYLAYRRDDIAHPLNGTGVVIPPTEGRRIDGITWVSSKWNHRAPPRHALVRVFFGGPHTRAMLDLDDAKLTTIVCEELVDMLGVRAEPLFTRIFRWPDGYPQYDVGHLERVASVEAALPPGMVVAGSSYRGVGVPDCIHQGELAAEKIVETVRSKQTAVRRLPA